MHEAVELHEGHYEQGDNPLILPVSITISIMAVLVAGVTLLGHRAHTEELLRQSQASDRWAQFQAKSVRLHETQGFSDVVNIVASLDKEKGEALREKYSKQVEHYESDKEDVRPRFGSAQSGPLRWWGGLTGDWAGDLLDHPFDPTKGFLVRRHVHWRAGCRSCSDRFLLALN